MSLYMVVATAVAVGLLTCVAISSARKINKADNILEHRTLDDVEKEEDGEVNVDSDKLSVILVSTMDGKITALNANGNVLWSLNVDDQPLLAGTFNTHQKMIAGELPYTIVPSLNGSLFMVTKQNSFWPILLTADISRVINDVAISGGSVNSKTGIDPITGEIKYRCTFGKCEQTVPTTMSTRTLLMTRNTHTARAVDPITGSEKWNLSVSEYMLQLFDQNGSPQTVSVGGANDIGLRLEWTGVVSLYDSDHLSWEYRLSSPIARVWLLSAGQLKEISLFDSNYITALNGYAASIQQSADGFPRSEMSYYLGSYNAGLYIIQSEKMRKQTYASNVQPYGSVDALRRKFQSSSNELQTLSTIDDSSKWLSFFEKCVDGEFFALENSGKDNTEPNIEEGMYSTLLTESKNSRSSIRGTSDGTSSTRNQLASFIAVEYRKELLRSWWQIGGIITTFVGCLSVMFFMLKAFHSEVIADALESKIVEDQQQIIAGTMTGNTESSISSVTTASSNTYVSKFFEDFTPIRCLGRGGYGVVFNCKHKLDERNYAVKRITVSNTASAIERVTREAKAMAKLDHPGIIRYFHTWIEKPPAGWQQAKDKEILEQIRMLDSSSGLSFSDPSKQQSDINLNHLSTEDDSLLNQKKNATLFMGESFNNVWLEKKTKASEESSGSWMMSGNIALSNSTTTSSSGSSNSANESKSLSPSITTDENSSSIVFAQETGSLRQEIIRNNGSSTSSSSSSLSSKPLEPPLVLVADDAVLKSCGKTKDYIYLYIQMELCQELTLHNWLLNNKDEASHEISKMRFWFTQLVCAVDYIHEQGLIHRDIKPQNIFFSADCQNTLKIGDLGLATNLEPEESSSNAQALSTRRHTGNVGTRLYMSPEQLKGKAYNQKVDVFSLGLIFTEMLIPFQTVMERHEVLTTLRNGVLPPHYLSELSEERNFILWLTTEDPTSRPSSAEVMHCAYLKSDMHPMKIN